MTEIAHRVEHPAGDRMRRTATALRRNLHALGDIMSYPSGAAGLVVVLLFVAIALLAPLIAPYGAFEVVYNADHSVVRLSPPSWPSWLGTTHQGVDVSSPLTWGSRVALIVGLLSALGSVVLGTLIGLVAGYFGGWIDEAL